MQKSRLTKVLCLLLFCAMLGSLFACAKDETPPQTETQGPSDASDFPVTLAEADGTSYAIVMSGAVTDVLRAKVIELYQMIVAATGADVRIGDDYVSADAGVKEILIGNTKREESIAVMSEIGYFDSAVRVMQNKVVVAAHTEQGMLGLLDILMNELIDADKAEKRVVLTKEYSHVSERKAYFDTENKLKDYVLVYPKEDRVIEEHAESIAKRLERNFGVKLTVRDDGATEVDKEILLGKTNRTSVTAYYTGEAAPDSLHILIKAVGSKLIVTGSTAYTAPLACEVFRDVYLDNSYTSVFNFEKELSELRVAHKIDKHSERLEDAELRIMSYNVLSKELTDTAAEFDARKDLIGTTILYYMPDVIGVQEVDAGAYATLEADLGSTYAFTNKKTPAGLYSYTSILYNKNTVKYLEGDNILYSLGNQRIRLVSWGLFEHKSTGEKFLMLSTHWDIVQQNRQTDAEEMTQIVKDLREQYKCPVITTGDFNSPESTTYYKQYLKDTEQTEARYAAEHIGFASSGEVIDHITSDAGVKTVFFKLLKTELTAKASDHDPIYADFKFQ